MCGITGIYHFNTGKEVSVPVLKKMCDAIAHRGPDSEGIYVTQGKRNAGLGIRRLAVIDLHTGDQPIHNEDSTLWTVLNGEIYNFRELRKDLSRRHSFYTQTDTEVILHLYEEYGEECVQHLRGMFAFAVWDEPRQRLFLAKDRLGKKPLFYSSIDGTLVFSSEIRSLLASLPSTPEVDPESVDRYLTYQYIPAPRTIFKGIYSLPPAHTLTCARSGISQPVRYWDLDFRKKSCLSFSDSCRKVQELLREATRLRMIADVPLGAFLSGGYDSSVVVGLMSQLSPVPVKTFTVGFEESEFSEIPYAREVARHFRTDHHEVIVKPDFIEMLPVIAKAYGQPFADSSALPSFIVSRETRKEVTVALTGDGGDEAFGGYERYRMFKRTLSLPPLHTEAGRAMFRLISSFLPAADSPGTGAVGRYLSRASTFLAQRPSGRNVMLSAMFGGALRRQLYSDDFMVGLNADSEKYSAELFEHALAARDMDRLFYTDIHSYLPECLLVKMDIASMAHSLEVRSPFLDHTLLEFSASLPDTWKMRGAATKYLLRKSFDGFLPEMIQHRGKMGFGIPVDAWFRGSWKNYFTDIVLSSRSLQRGYFNRHAIERLLQEHASGSRSHGYRLFTLLMFELWHRSLLDNEGAR